MSATLRKVKARHPEALDPDQNPKLGRQLRSARGVARELVRAKGKRYGAVRIGETNVLMGMGGAEMPEGEGWS